jgi:hypothetical protein
MCSFYCRLLLAGLLCAVLSRPIVGEDNTQDKLEQVKTIFVIPMKDRLEHFLTHELVGWGYFQVTLNPREADALLSDTTDVSVKELLQDPPKVRKTRARTRGTAFLINMRTEKILWSAAVKPSESFLLGGDKSNRELAQEIVRLLKKNLQTK